MSVNKTIEVSGDLFKDYLMLEYNYKVKAVISVEEKICDMYCCHFESMNGDVDYKLLNKVEILQFLYTMQLKPNKYINN